MAEEGIVVPQNAPVAEAAPAEANKSSQMEKQETDSDDEYKDIDIKRKLKEFRATNPPG